MIDIRAVATAINEIKLTDPSARQAAIHEHLRNYGVELLLNLRNAILPTNESELAVVEWLKKEVESLAAQIPSPIQPKKQKDPAK